MIWKELKKEPKQEKRKLIVLIVIKLIVKIVKISKIQELEEELNIVGNNVKSLEVSEEKVSLNIYNQI